MWDLRAAAPRVLIDRAEGVSSVDIRPDGEEIAVGFADGSVSTFRASDSKVGRSWRVVGEPIHLAYAPDGRSLAVADASSVIVYDGAAGTARARLSRPVVTSSIAWHPRGETLAVADGYGQIAIWDVRRDEIVRTCNGRTGGVKIAFTPDGTMISSTAWDGLWRLHDVGSGSLKLVEALTLGQQFGRGDRLVAGPSVSEMGLAEVATGRECRTLLNTWRRGEVISGVRSIRGAGSLRWRRGSGPGSGI